MNRNKALEWCVEHITKWPLRPHDAAPQDWKWHNTQVGLILMRTDGFNMPITEADWLAATDNMNPRMDEIA